jgi:hypothetical protein
VKPLARGGAGADAIARRATLLSAVAGKIDVDIPNSPSLPMPKIRLEPRTTGTVEIVNGKGGQVFGINDVRRGGQGS